MKDRGLSRDEVPLPKGERDQTVPFECSTIRTTRVGSAWSPVTWECAGADLADGALEPVTGVEDATDVTKDSRAHGTVS
jgi:hypothetical protein